MFYSKNGLMNPSKHDARKVLGDGVADSKSITQFDDLQLLILDCRPPIIHPNNLQETTPAKLQDCYNSAHSPAACV